MSSTATPSPLTTTVKPKTGWTYRITVNGQTRYTGLTRAQARSFKSDLKINNTDVHIEREQDGVRIR